MEKDSTTSSEYIFDEVSDEEANNFKLDPYLIRLIDIDPFFSYILMNLKRVRTGEIPTAGVTATKEGLTLYWNPKFLASLEKRQVLGLLKHECYHLVFKHCTSRKRKPHQMWNFATDLAINSLIDFKDLPEGGLFPGKALANLDKVTDPAQLKAWKRLSELIESFPKDQASEWYFNKLMSDEELKEAMDKLPPSNSGEPMTGIPGMDDHEGWGDGLSQEERQQIEDEVKELVKKAAGACDKSSSKGWGSVSAKTQEKIRKSFQNTIDWKKVLANFIGRRQRAKKSSTYRKINRKYPYIHPGRKIGHTSNLAVYIDQSGSISHKDITAFTGVLTGLAKNVTFTFYNFDTIVDESSKQVWKKGKKNINIPRTVTGGTCFDCVEEHFRKHDNFDGYIVLTDGAASKPKPCKKRRCWVILPKYKLYFEKDSKDMVVNMKH